MTTLGFTGTQAGMTPDQFAAVERFVYARAAKWAWAPMLSGDVHTVVHGDCVGADEQFDEIACRLGLDRVFWPSDVVEKRARCDLKRPGRVLVHPALPPLERNDLIIRADVMIAAPKGPEERRSGTWTTIRHRVKTGRGITIFWPDGSRTERG